MTELALAQQRKGFFFDMTLERLLEVFCINACFCPRLPSHFRSLESLHLYELSLGWRSGKGGAWTGRFL